MFSHLFVFLSLSLSRLVGEFSKKLKRLIHLFISSVIVVLIRLL